MKKYKYPAKIWRKKVKKYFKELEIIEDNYFRAEEVLQKKMAKETGIKDIEVFWADNSMVGIGNTSRTMELIHRRMGWFGWLFYY